jgi:hypothetical protein
MNWRFQFDTDCSDTLALRAASAIDSSPASTDNTSRVLSSGGNALGRDIRNLQGQVKLRPEPDFLKRDRRLKQFRTLATRCAKRVANYRTEVVIATIAIWLRDLQDTP